MIDLTKGLSLFTIENTTDYTVSGLINFLSDEYNFLNISFSVDKFGMSPLMSKIKVTEGDYKKKIKENLFRVEALIIYYPYRIKTQDTLFKYLQDLDIMVFIVTTKKGAYDIIDESGYIRNFYQLIDNPNYTPATFQSFSNMNTLLSDGIKFDDKYLFHNINSDEKFTLDQYKVAYIRDKKIDIFLDNDDAK